MPCDRLQFRDHTLAPGRSPHLRRSAAGTYDREKSKGNRLNADSLIAFPETFPRRRNGAW